jgi:predicted ferric reductase
MSNETWWYVARSGGIVAWCLLALSVFWGLALSSRFLGRAPKPNWMLDLHRFVGGLAVVFTAVHVVALVADGYIEFGLLQILVPFTSHYRASAVAWGVVALYLLAAVEITSLLRQKLSRRLWRATHFLSFPLFASATIHLLTAGTDSAEVLLRITVALSVGLIVIGTLIRVVQAVTRPPRPPRVSIPVRQEQPWTTATRP